MGKSTRKTQTLLPAVFQTPKNTDFLEATLDQLIEPAKVQKLSQFVGRTTEANYKINDGYVPELNEDRTNYQLENPFVPIFELFRFLQLPSHQLQLCYTFDSFSALIKF